MTNVRTLAVGDGSEEMQATLDQLAGEGARRMIAAALRAEADEYVERFSDEVDEDGHRLVVRNRRGRERRVMIGSGTIPVRAPRVNDKRVDEETGERQRFSSRILPAYARRSPRLVSGMKGGRCRCVVTTGPLQLLSASGLVSTVRPSGTRVTGPRLSVHRE